MIGFDQENFSPLYCFCFQSVMSLVPLVIERTKSSGINLALFSFDIIQILLFAITTYKMEFASAMHLPDRSRLPGQQTIVIQCIIDKNHFLLLDCDKDKPRFPLFAKLSSCTKECPPRTAYHLTD